MTKRARLAWIGLLGAAACKGDDSGPDPDPDTEDPTPVACAPQDWPIDQEGHQADRVDEDWRGKMAFHWMPPNPRGVVAVFHGSNQTAGTMRTVEHEELYNELVERDLGYFAVGSIRGDWDREDPADSVDIDNVVSYLERLLQDTSLTADTPLFSLGFSGGGAFNVTFANGIEAHGWDYRGFSTHNSSRWETAPVPSVFVSGANDHADEIRDNHQRQVDTGFDSTLYALEEIPLDPLRFTKIADIGEARSRSWFDEAVAFGMVDADGNRLSPIQDVNEVMDDFQDNSTGTGNPLATAQMRVLWRTHIFAADRACDEAAFFDSLL